MRFRSVSLAAGRRSWHRLTCSALFGWRYVIKHDAMQIIGRMCLSSMGVARGQEDLSTWKHLMNKAILHMMVRKHSALLVSAESAGSKDHAAAALLLAAQETRSRHFAFALLLRQRQLFCNIFRLHLRVSVINWTVSDPVCKFPVCSHSSESTPHQ